jgi:hypothetical protein
MKLHTTLLLITFSCTPLILNGCEEGKRVFGEETKTPVVTTEEIGNELEWETQLGTDEVGGSEERNTAEKELTQGEQWKIFRDNEEEYKGERVTWKMKVLGIYSDTPHCYLYYDYNDTPYVDLTGVEGFTYNAAVMLGKLPVVHDNDWLLVTGEFVGVNSDGDILLKPIKVENLGVQ